MERRKNTVSKSSPLPNDYLGMVEEVFKTHFDAALKIYEGIRPHTHFEASGGVFADEIILVVSLMSEGQLAATTVHASCDFDPKASAPTVQDLLSCCVDAIGTVFSIFMDPSNPTSITELAEKESLSSFENIPFHWTSLESNQRKVFVKLDKSNPKLDAIADDWLSKNDPTQKQVQEEEQKETEKLFFTGPKKPEK